MSDWIRDADRSLLNLATAANIYVTQEGVPDIQARLVHRCSEGRGTVERTLEQGNLDQVMLAFEQLALYLKAFLRFG